MQVYIITTTQYLLCLVSMLLTGLFALSFASSQTLQIPFDFAAKDYIAAILMVIIGLCIDLSKYLFWHNRGIHQYFFVISILLVLFSWAASIAFFVSQEQMNIEMARKDTVAYQAHEASIQAVKLEITEKRKLVEKRLGSKYHSQWEKGERSIDGITNLQTHLQKLVMGKKLVGLEEAQLQITTSAFFLSLSALFSMPANMIANIIYALLALLIEVCALGMISLSAYVNQKENDKVENLENALFDNDELVDLTKEKIEKLRDKIINKEIDSKNLYVKYLVKSTGLSVTLVKAILESFCNEGRLRKDRHSYVYTD